MHILLEQYKAKLSHLPLSILEKEKVIKDFEKEVVLKLVRAFYDHLTMEEKDLLGNTTTDEELITVYLSIIEAKIDHLDFLEFLDKAYVGILMQSLHALPNT